MDFPSITYFTLNLKIKIQALLIYILLSGIVIATINIGTKRWGSRLIKLMMWFLDLWELVLQEEYGRV